MVAFAHRLLASERSERDTIRGVQIRAGVVYIYTHMYGGTCATLVAHATHTYVGGVKATAIFYTCQQF